MLDMGRILKRGGEHHDSSAGANGMGSFQLFVKVFDTCVVWYVLVLSCGEHSAANMTSLRATDGNATYRSHEPLPLVYRVSQIGSKIIISDP